MTALADSSVPTKVLFIDRTFSFSLHFFLLLLIIEITGVCFREDFFLLFTIIYPKTNMMLLRKLRLVNNLPTHIRENTGFLRQLPSAEANFEG